MLQSETDFIEQFARVLLVHWCTQTLAHGSIVDAQVAGGFQVDPKVADLCLLHAIDKKWVSKNEPRKVLSGGFSVATSFLRR